MKKESNIRYLGKEIRKNTENYLMLAPYSVFFLTFTVIPICVAIYLSFTYFNLLQPAQFRGFFNYTRLFLEDEIFLKSLKNTLVFAVVTGPISYFLCILFAWMINEFGPVMRNVMTLIFYAPSISGSLYVIWSYIFSGDSYGLVNSTLLRLGLIEEPVLWFTNPKYALGIIIVVQIWLSLGTSFLALIAGLQGVDRSLYEAGAIDGIRNRFQELIKITLPSMGPSMMFAAVMQISSSFSVGAICNALAGFPSTDYCASTIVTHIMDYGNNRYEMGYACAIATVLFLMMFLMNQIVKAVLRRFNDA